MNKNNKNQGQNKELIYLGAIISTNDPMSILTNIDIEYCRCENKNSLTGRYLAGLEKIEVPKTRRKGNGKYLEVVKASQNNLKKINVKFPLGKFICVTGVSGSGKSTLVNEILCKTIANKLYRSKEIPGACKEVKGIENLDKLVVITQDAIGRTPRSNPATYIGVFDDIRDLFAENYKNH